MEVLYLLYGFTLGFGLIPVWLSLIEYGLKKSSSVSLKVAYGSVAANLFYVLLLFLGLGMLLQLQVVRKIVIMAGSIILIVIGLRSVWRFIRKKDIHHSRNAFRKGFWLTVTNPLPIMFWTYLSIPSLKDAVFLLKLSPVFNAAFVVIGVLLFFVLLDVIVEKFKSFFTERTVRLISTVFSALLIMMGAYGVYLSYIV